MKKNFIFIAALLIFNCMGIFAQQNSEKIKIIGESFVGKNINGIDYREITGNVKMTQGNIIVTCNKAIQNLSNDNVELFDDVLFIQDTIKLRTNKAYYLGNKKIAYSEVPVYLTDGHTRLYANTGKYFADDKAAFFVGRVVLLADSATLKSENLNYYSSNDSLFAFGNVSVTDSLSQLNCDSLFNGRKNKFSQAIGNVIVDDFKNNVKIFCGELINYSAIKYSRILNNPIVLQIDTLSNGKLDSLFIASKMMESYQDSTNKLLAMDSVQIVRGEFSSVNDYTLFYRTENRIVTKRPVLDKPQPVLWYSNSQLTGDSICIYIDEGEIKNVSVIGNSNIVSVNKDYNLRYDQVAGDSLYLSFSDNQLKITDVRGNVLSIYYMFDEGEPNGLIKSSGERIKLLFENNEVIKVNMYGSPKSEFHPENVISGNEKEFTIPSFQLYKNRPNKNNMIKKMN